jgi:type VI protein secretion system component VasF
MNDTTELGGDIRELRQRTTILTWAVGIIAALVIAMLGNTITMSYQLGTTLGRLDVLIERAQLK